MSTEPAALPTRWRIELLISADISLSRKAYWTPDPGIAPCESLEEAREWRGRMLDQGWKSEFIRIVREVRYVEPNEYLGGDKDA
jgi:hypothetical protein